MLSGLASRAALFVIASPIIVAWWGGGIIYAAWKTVVVGDPPHG
jgi:hypothetical protein